MSDDEVSALGCFPGFRAKSLRKIPRSIIVRRLVASRSAEGAPMSEVIGRLFRFGRYTLDLRRGCLRCDDRDVELRPKSFDVLRYLVQNAGRLVSKDELIEAVWPNVAVTDDSLTRC